MDIELKYGLDDRPGGMKTTFLGLQHVLTMLGATIAVPTIIAGAYGLSVAETALLISNVLVAMGIATFVQIKFGSRLPIIQGSSFAFLPALLYVATLYPDVEGLQYAMGALMVGAVFQFFLGMSKVAGLLQRVLTPVVVGPTIIVIGLSLFSVGGSEASTNWIISGLTGALILVLSFGINGLKGTHQSWFSTFPVILAITIAWLICFGLSMTGVIGANESAYIDLASLKVDSIVKTSGYILPWGLPKFDVAFLLVFLIAYLVSTVESVGDYNAISEITTSDDRPVTQETVNRGVMAEGFGCFVSSLLGGVATTSYSENIGVVGITRVASRVVVMAAAALLIFIGLFPVFGNILATIPSPVIGGLYFVLFGMIAGVGLRYTAKANLVSMRNISIIGLSLFAGFAIPSVFGGADIRVILVETLGRGFADTLLGVLTSSMAVTAMTALFWDSVLTKEPAEIRDPS